MLIMKTVSRLLIVLLTVIERSCSSMKVVGRAGENITLPCKYDIRYNGARSACWNRGSIPLLGCNNQIISTDGHKVIEPTRVSSRYQLLGRLEDGNVSLMILNTTEEDAGRYGCRVDIYGWFNDDNHHIDLIIEKVIERSSSSMKVVGRAGENITLPCKHDIRYNGVTEVCWGRGSISLSGCNNQIISTDGHKVIESTRVSSRYQLLGRLEDGDVSLTILNTTEEDAGRYGCLVHIPGWFNDQKHHIDLIIEKVNPPASTTAATTTARGRHVTLVEELCAQQVNNLHIFIGNTMKLFIVFLIPALLLIAAYRVWRTNQSTATDRRQNQSEERDSSV